MDLFASWSDASWLGDGFVDSLEASLARWELTPRRIVGLYLVFGFVGLYVSDVVFAEAFSEPLRSQVQAAKGALEVLVTGGFIYAITLASRRQLERTNRQLERRNEELHVLHRVLRHNLRNDLNVIEGNAEYVEAALADDDLAENCRAISRTAEEIVAYIERASQIRRLTENDVTETFDLTEVVPIIVERLEANVDPVDVTIELPDRAAVAANHMLSAAIEELLTNAVIHAERDEPTVSICVSEEDTPQGMTAIEIHDDGPGIPEGVRRVIESDERDQLAHLDGLGLWFVHWTVTDTGGTLSFDVDGGTTVRLLVPTAEAD